mmetsp:Transcript_10707/g.37728  ORF Transcript_10707/g.37728 Transcript_10707/m.37728 type:complete len:409 (-) Transcript_10707:559-1785(-)
MDSDEVAVIDDEVITAALLSGAGADGSKAPRSAQNAGSASPPGLADLVAGAATLKLSFKNVRDIDNLIGFQNLTKLCLDNNIIRGIANLDHLVNLTWLDLSFNCISKMAGLSKLSKLTDLSLFNNQIAEIDGLEHCRDLQCLSLGNNQIAALDSVVKLRAFKKLQLLNLEGNPVSKEGEYRMYVLAYLHDLTYFDFSMVLKAETVVRPGNGRAGPPKARPAALCGRGSGPTRSFPGGARAVPRRTFGRRGERSPGGREALSRLGGEEAHGQARGGEFGRRGDCFQRHVRRRRLGRAPSPPGLRRPAAVLPVRGRVGFGLVPADGPRQVRGEAARVLGLRRVFAGVEDELRHGVDPGGGNFFAIQETVLERAFGRPAPRGRVGPRPAADCAGGGRGRADGLGSWASGKI